MERTFQLGDKAVTFRATGATIRLYRQIFQRDILQDMTRIQNEAVEGEVTPEALGFLENVAYTMAKQADPNIPDTADEWLDQFDMFSLYQIFPEIIKLWGTSTATLSESKKKALAQTDR